MFRTLFITIILSLVLFIGIVQAKWIAIMDIRTIDYNKNGNYESSHSTKQAVDSYDKASTCLKILRIKFDKSQRNVAEIKAALDAIESVSYWFNAQFPTIDSKSFMEGMITSHIIEYFSCEEEK